ncbi:MAG TPA: hypothetical protein VHJ78_09580 [Actinomycetota bacterium]|nr:hypothetical protein [Actinomycetota bacterium]
MRTPVFELHIRPMFRSIDREHMMNLFGDWFDLWSCDVLQEHIDRVIESLEADFGMPPVGKGGPWPPEWIALLRRWKQTGFKRLKLGSGSYEVFRTEDVVELVASFTLPAPGWAGWLELESRTEDSRTYALYFEEPDEPQEGSGEQVDVSEQFTGVDKLFVRDAQGLSQVEIPS